MQLSPEDQVGEQMIKPAYIDSVQSFLGVIEQIKQDQWDSNALD